MQLIGFNFSKINAEKIHALSPSPTVNTNIEFTDVVKDELALLKDAEVARIGFRFSVIYHAPSPKKESKEQEKENPPSDASVIFEGNLLFATPKEKLKELLKHWKKREIPQEIKIPLFNLILHHCTTKALELEEHLSLPPHIPLPQIKPQPQT